MDHCITKDIVDSAKVILVPRIQLCPSDPIFPFKLGRLRFPTKITFLWQSIRLKGRRLNVLEYIYHRLFFP